MQTLSSEPPALFQDQQEFKQELLVQLHTYFVVPIDIQNSYVAVGVPGVVVSLSFMHAIKFLDLKSSISARKKKFSMLV